METAARARGLAAESDARTRGRALGDSASARRVVATKVPGAYTRITARGVNAGAHCASAQRAILIGHAAIRIARNSPENNTLHFSNRLKNPHLHARFSRVSRSKTHHSRVTHRAARFTNHQSLLTNHAFLFDTNKPRKITILLSAPLKTKENRFSIQYKSLRPIRPNYLKIEIPFEVSDAANFVCSSSDPALRSGPERPTTQH